MSFYDQARTHYQRAFSELKLPRELNPLLHPSAFLSDIELASQHEFFTKPLDPEAQRVMYAQVHENFLNVMKDAQEKPSWEAKWFEIDSYSTLSTTAAADPATVADSIIWAPVTEGRYSEQPPGKLKLTMGKPRRAAPGVQDKPQYVFNPNPTSFT